MDGKTNSRDFNASLAEVIRPISVTEFYFLFLNKQTLKLNNRINKLVDTICPEVYL